MALHDLLHHLEVGSCDIFSMVVLEGDAEENAS